MNASTRDLIDELTDGLMPVRRRAVALRLALGVGVGAVAAAALMLAWLGLREDLGVAATGWIFWVKALYTAALALAGCLAVERLARPGERANSASVVGASAFAVVALLALAQWASLPEPDTTLLFGHTASFCPLAIVVLSAPVFACTVLALRTLAPTRLTRAGAAAGFVSGAVAAVVYAASCAETGIAFLASWYTLGTIATTMIGAALGRPLLRW